MHLSYLFSGIDGIDNYIITKKEENMFKVQSKDTENQVIAFRSL